MPLRSRSSIALPSTAPNTESCRPPTAPSSSHSSPRPVIPLNAACTLAELCDPWELCRLDAVSCGEELDCRSGDSGKPRPNMETEVTLLPPMTPRGPAVAPRACEVGDVNEKGGVSPREPRPLSEEVPEPPLMVRPLPMAAGPPVAPRRSCGGRGLEWLEGEAPVTVEVAVLTALDT